MDKKILIVCNYFAPENTIAAVRTSNLAKFFSEEGYAVDFVTERKKIKIIDNSLLDGLSQVHVYYLENGIFCKKVHNFYDNITKKARKKRMSCLNNREKINPKTGNIEFYPFETAYPVMGSFDYLIEQYRQKNLAKNIMQVTNNKEYDYMITSYGDSFAFFCGRTYKRKHRNTYWIFDIRDAIYRYKFTPDYVKWIPLSYEKYIWKNADAIVGVSKGICNRVSRKYSNKVSCITNGYDKDISNLTSERMLEDKMTFVYTGSMYGGLQNLSDFFEVVDRLVNCKQIDREKLAFIYAGNESAYYIFRGQAEKYNLDNQCVYYGKINRQSAIELQKKSDILLMASYDYKDNNGGVITGKLFEYMASQKPVIAIVTGDGINSEVSQIISDTRIGICIEKAAGEEKKQLLSDYIIKQYNHFINREPIEYNPNIAEVQKYDYKNISKKYLKLIEDMKRR